MAEDTEPVCNQPTDWLLLSIYAIQPTRGYFSNFHEKKNRLSSQVELNSKYDKPQLAPTLVARINFSL